MKNYKEGQEVTLNTGEVAIFVRGKRKNFIGNINGTNFDIPFSMIITPEELEKKKEDIPKSINPNSLKKGDFFYINKNDKAILFIFKEVTSNGKVIGENPITKRSANIDKNFDFFKVSNG